MLKRRSFLLLLVAGVLFCHSIVNYNHQVRVLTDNYQSYILVKERHLQSYMIVANALGQQKQWDKLEGYLTDAVNADLIDFYLLEYKGSPLYFGSYQNSFDPVQFVPSPTDDFVVSPTASYQTLSFETDYRLTLGLSKNLEVYITKNMESYSGMLWEEAIYYGIIVLLVALWLFRDVFKILTKVRSGRASEIANIKTLSYESELLARGFSGFAQVQNELKTENQTLGNLVLPSLKNELQSGRNPPYDFTCTLVRTDINNFSHIYNSHDVTKFMAVINDFFSEVSHTVSRYGGFVHEFVGDEVIYYFKDEHHTNSFLTALSAARDINLIAESFNERTSVSYGHAFTIKSSLAHGSLRYGRLVNGFSLAGSVLIETVRILSDVTEKSGNVIALDSRHLDRIQNVCQTEKLSETILKGFPGTRVLHFYRSHRPLSAALKDLENTGARSLLPYFRSDRDLIEILSYLQENSGTLSQNVVLDCCGILRRAVVTKTDPALIEALWKWIGVLEDLDKMNAYAASPLKVLSSAISTIPSLVPKDKFDSHCILRLTKLCSNADARVVANAMSVLNHFNVAVGKQLQAVLSSNSHPRVVATLILLESRREISKNMIKRIRALLQDSRPEFVASGLYIVGELALAHRRSDRVVYEMQVEFAQLLESLTNFVDHDNPSIRKQALAAISKCKDHQKSAA